MCIYIHMYVYIYTEREREDGGALLAQRGQYSGGVLEYALEDDSDEI